MMTQEELANLCFECQQCGKCCTGAPGYVFFTLEESKKMAEYLGLNERDFGYYFCRKVIVRGKQAFSLKEKPNYDCIFLENQHCQIYLVRPDQCKTYPFWPRIIESRAAWEKEKAHCPGIGKGQALGMEKIQQILKKKED